MAVANLFKINGEKVGDIELPSSAFETKVNKGLVYQYIKVYQWRNHQHTLSAKTRSEVRGGGRKPWRQKGTGRARVGSIRSPLWSGGGVIFPPRPERRLLAMPKKMKRLAFASVLSDRAKESRIRVLEEFKFDTPKTSQLKTVLKAMALDNTKTRKLILTPKVDKNLYLASRNMKSVNVKHIGEVNVYDLLIADDLIILQSALPLIEKRVRHTK